MRSLLLFFLLSFLYAAPAFAEAERACPHGFSVVNGKCTPPCAAGERRSLSGACTPIHCNMGLELVGNSCKQKCPMNKTRVEETGKCVAPNAQ